MSRSRLANVITAAGLIAFSVQLSWQFAEIGWLGWDAYPILASCGPIADGGLASLVARPLGDGLLPVAFFRPMLCLSIALEWPLWGLSAGAYVAVNAVLLGLCGFALFRLMVRFGASSWAGLFAVAFFVWHPAVADVVPYLPRRPELLCTLFVLLAVRLDHPNRFDRSRLSRAGSLLASAAAVSSKETAIVVPLLIAAARWLFPVPGATRRRAVAAGLAAHAAVVLAIMLVRFQVLGGVGGYPGGIDPQPGAQVRTLIKTLLSVFLPSLADRMFPLLGLLALVLGVGVWMLFQRTARGISWHRMLLDGVGEARLRLGAFSIVWLLTFAAVYGTAARLSPWYLLIAAAGGSISFGLMLDLVASRLSTGPRGRLALAGALAGGLLLLGSFAIGSPAFSSLPEYVLASRDAEIFLSDLETEIRQTPDGGRIDAGPYPRLTIGVDGRQVPTLVPHSLAGWARIVTADRNVAFFAANQEHQVTQSGAVSVQLGAGIHRNLANE